MPYPTHVSLVVLAATIGLLGTASYVGVGDEPAATTASPVAARALPLLAPATRDPRSRSSRTGGSSRLVHPLIGATRSTLETELGPPVESYVGGRYTFLAYQEGANRYQVVLEAGVVIEVSQIT